MHPWSSASQSIKNYSLKFINLLYFKAYYDSIIPVVENAQQAPHPNCCLTSVTTFFSLQSKFLGSYEISMSLCPKILSVIENHVYYAFKNAFSIKPNFLFLGILSWLIRWECNPVKYYYSNYSGEISLNLVIPYLPCLSFD